MVNSTTKRTLLIPHPIVAEITHLESSSNMNWAKKIPHTPNRNARRADKNMLAPSDFNSISFILSFFGIV